MFTNEVCSNDLPLRMVTVRCPAARICVAVNSNSYGAERSPSAGSSGGCHARAVYGREGFLTPERTLAGAQWIRRSAPQPGHNGSAGAHPGRAQWIDHPGAVLPERNGCLPGKMYRCQNHHTAESSERMDISYGLHETIRYLDAACTEGRSAPSPARVACGK